MSVDTDEAKESYIFDVLEKAEFEYGQHPFNSLTDKEQAGVIVVCKEKGISVDEWYELKRRGK